MKNRDHAIAYTVALLSVVFCPALMACVINDPPVAVCYPSPVFHPLDACNAGLSAEVCGGNSYDSDNYPFCCDNGITWHSWWCSTGTITGYYGQIHQCAYVMFSSTGKKQVYQWVYDDDYPTAEDSAICDVWIFDIGCSLSESVIGVGETATLTLSHSPSNLPGYERLFVNIGSCVEVLEGENVVIGGSDLEEMWNLSRSNPSSVTVRGTAPGYATLTLQYTPDGQVYPGGEYNGNSVAITAVGVTSVGSDKDGACVGCDIAFATSTNPPNHEDLVVWSGGGTPSTGSGFAFTTHWDTPGVKTVTAACGTSTASKQVTIASPTNYRETCVEVQPNGVLYFQYSWDSTSGNLADLDGCTVGEQVDYPGGNPYIWPTPWNTSTANPTIASVPATNGVCSDTHYPMTIVAPYTGAAFTASQIYGYGNCVGGYSTLMGPLEIQRFISGEEDVWRYSILKSGAYAEIFPLP